MPNILIQNVRMIDPSQKIDRLVDLLLVDGKVAAIEEPYACATDAAAVVIDGTDLVAAPGLVDMHVHLRDPGFTHKEDILSGCEAAAAGGVTSLACMPNTNPVIDSPETVSYILNRAKSAKAKVYPVCTLTDGLKGETLSDYMALKQAGAVGASDDGRPVPDAKKMQQAMIQAGKAGLRVMSHCEDLGIIDHGIMNAGKVSETLGVKGMDRLSEDMITMREIMLAEYAKVAIHIAHVSTAGSVELIRQAKRRGVLVTCETAPHYLMFTDEKLLSKDADYRMNPPLRTEADCRAMIEGILDGTVDAIATDHAPHTKAEKADFLTAPNGVVGMETSLAAMLTCMVHPGKLSLGRLIELMSVRPAELLGIQAGSLKIGMPADVVLIDTEKRWVVDPAALHSKSHNAVMKGMELTGKVHTTICDGNITYSQTSEL